MNMAKKETDELSVDTLQLPQRSQRRPAKDLRDRAALVILSGKHFGTSFVFKRYATLIGRLKKCDVTLEDPSISKVHCTIVMDDEGRCVIDDMVSTNTTYVNGKRIRRGRTLNAGDTIIVGNTVLVFLESIAAPE
jgi:predicted component of type VI protein secretion system